jgi:hypothetical protein
MNKAWITGLTLAGVAGSAGAAYAGISSADQNAPSVEAQGFVEEATTTTIAPARSFTYQVGDAGSVAVTVDGGVITVDSALAGALPWTVGTFSTPAAHVEVQFTNGMQQVTFIADLVNGEVVVSLTNVAAPGVTTPPATLEITNITNGPAPTAPAAPAPMPASPPAKATTFLPVPAPSGSHTSATSSAGTSDDDGHESDDSHDSNHENDSHESDHESGGGSDD